ncbi:MAG TPA: extensin family protein, partial [Pseudolabrys sp.]
PAEQQQRYAPAIEPSEVNAPAGRPISLYPPGVAPEHDDIPDDAVLPSSRGPAPASPRSQPAYNAPRDEPPQQQPRALPPLGPMRGPQTTGAIMPAVLTPPATLACPIVSALDRWMSDGVQPAALRWFGAQVTEIKQISAYSCRGMNGNSRAHISEHAFGNALDIAGFTLADGRHVSVKDGWKGMPEEQGFLHDVQATACQQFTTVLAPGSNVYHYDHIHVDLMRRASRRLICQPAAISGEEVAARAGQRNPYASREPFVTGSLGGSRHVSHRRKASDKVNEEDEFEDE